MCNHRRLLGRRCLRGGGLWFEKLTQSMHIVGGKEVCQHARLKIACDECSTRGLRSYCLRSRRIDIVTSEMPQLDFLGGCRKGAGSLTLAGHLAISMWSWNAGVVRAILHQNDPTRIQRMSNGHISHNLACLYCCPSLPLIY